MTTPAYRLIVSVWAAVFLICLTVFFIRLCLTALGFWTGDKDASSSCSLCCYRIQNLVWLQLRNCWWMGQGLDAVFVFLKVKEQVGTRPCLHPVGFPFCTGWVWVGVDCVCVSLTVHGVCLPAPLGSLRRGKALACQVPPPRTATAGVYQPAWEMALARSV